MKLNDLKNKKILILGYGREGKDNFLALRKLFPNKILAVADKKKIKQPDKKTKVYAGKNYLQKIGDWQVIIKTPGIPLTEVKPCLQKKSRITSQTEIFFDNFAGLIIGVSGTKGKGTTASLIYYILKKAGLKARLVGNIGQPVLQKLVELQQKKNRGIDEIFIYELSSHQLQNLKRSPRIAVFLNLFPDHLDYYQGIGEYKKAKEPLAKYQTRNDFFIYQQEDKTAKEFAQKSRGKKIGFSLKNKNELYQIVKPKKIILKGGFNLLNMLAALKTAQLLKIEPKQIKEGILAFKGLPHRLEFIGSYQGIQFYNDSMSTLPEATLAALKALGQKVETLLLGGSDKGSDYTELAKLISQIKVKNLIILGQGTGQKVWQKITSLKKALPKKFVVKTMKSAVQIAFQETAKGKICLLSPGSASFNLFKNYQARGTAFKKWVKYYGQKNS